MNAITLKLECSLTNLDWQVVEMAKADGPRSLRPDGFLARLSRDMFGLPITRKLANEKLEALRRFCVRAWFWDLIRTREVRALVAAGYTSVDVFQIRQDALRGLTLTAGSYVASRVFLSLQQPIQLTSEAQNAGSTFGPGFELEYTAHRWLRANFRGGNVAPRFFLRGRYAF